MVRSELWKPRLSGRGKDEIKTSTRKKSDKPLNSLGSCIIKEQSRNKDDISFKSVSVLNLEFQDNPEGKPVAIIPSKIGSVYEKSISSCGQIFARHQSEGDDSIDKRIARFTFPTKYEPTTNEKQTSDISIKKRVDKKSVAKTAPLKPDARSCYPLKGSKPREGKALMACSGSIVAGAPKPFVGVCPENFAEISKLSKPKQKFYITQDPRKVHCLINPEAMRSKGFGEEKEFKTLTGMVKYADNLCGEEASHSEHDFVCEVMDPENPLQLDFQGLDYKFTYDQDEQGIVNQHVYRKLTHDLERKRMKKATVHNVEENFRKELTSIPKCFKVTDREAIADDPEIQSDRLCRLFRSEQKPENKQRLEKAREDRKERYKAKYLAQKEKEENLEKEKREKEKHKSINAGPAAAIKHFNKTNYIINENLKVSQINTNNVGRKQAVMTEFPHTIKETKRFKRKLRAKNALKRDEAKMKQDFYKQLGKEKLYPEANIELSSTSSKMVYDEDISTQSSDDDDEIKVGRFGSKIKLRGFHFKLGQNIRGKVPLNMKREAKHRYRRCETREEWLRALLPKKIVVKPDVYAAFEKPQSADDPNLVLFRPPKYEIPQKPEESAIHKMVMKPLGLQYESTKRKKIKIAKPKLKYSIKKFNFIKYSFGGDEAIEDPTKGKLTLAPEATTKEYIEYKETQREVKRSEKRKKRLDILGIPCEEIVKSRLETLCENSESSDSDWVPNRSDAGADTVSQKTISSVHSTQDIFFHENFSENESGGSNVEKEEKIKEELPKTLETPAKPFKLTLNMKGNMPAPKFREPTMKVNAHRPRNYQNERIPSALLEDILQESELPILLKMDPPKTTFENVKSPKRPYTKMLETRHHHDHWDPTDKPVVNVHYQPKVVKPKLAEPPAIKQKTKPKRFDVARPPCAANIDKDFTLPDYDIKGMLASHTSNKKKVKRKSVAEVKQDKCRPYEYYYHSRPNEDLSLLDFPGRQEYLNFLKEIRNSILEAKDQNARKYQGPGERLTIDKEQFYQELEQDLKSIESCLTSESSSECTNLTNDSGSFLLLEGTTKLPLDYVRNALVPFEEIQRSRFKFQIIDTEEEKNNPFRAVPYAGQSKEQVALAAPKDSFFTFNTRQRNTLRARLSVPTEDVREKLIGSEDNQYPGAVATDIDENYIKLMDRPPPIRICKFKTGAVYIKDALRRKFESMLIQGQIVRNKIFDQMNEHHWQNMLNIKTLYERIFDKWKIMEYKASMNIVYQVKSFYSKTDGLRIELHDLERKYTQLNMDIVFLEAYWIRCIQYQNFHYLMAEQHWRHEHDWIHSIIIGPNPASNEELSSEEERRRIDMEPYDVSIAKRPYLNIRERDKDDAWAIKDYYYNIYLKNLHPILQVFPNHQAFLDGVENLKSKTFVLLLEMHFTLSIHTELEERLQAFKLWCALELKNKREYVDRKCAKKYFMENRAANIRRKAYEFMDKPVLNSLNEPKILFTSAVVLEVWRNVVPPHLRGSEKGKRTSEMVAMIMDHVLEIINRFEFLDPERFKFYEKQIRADRRRQLKISKAAYIVERRIEANMAKIARIMETSKKPERPAKLPRIILKKKVHRITTLPRQMSDQTRNFLRAFHDDYDGGAIERGSLMVLDNMQDQIVPFYFDHFLKINGYTPNYNFRTQVELRDGPEINRMQVQYLVPEVVQKIEQWEELKKKIMEEHISRNPQMYVNVI